LLINHIGKNLRAINDYDSVADSDINIICVGTPSEDSGRANLKMVVSASECIGDYIKLGNKYQVVVVKSTVPPGTTETLVIPTVIERSGRNIDEIGFAMNPEFLREGAAIYDFMNPDRIVIGCSHQKAGDIVGEMYKGLTAPKIMTSISAAEMIKYASNAFLATKISFSNEIGNICKIMGIDTYEVMRGVGLDHRISPFFLNAGAGFGGSCFPKDVSALIHHAETLGENPVLLKAVMDVNNKQPSKIVNLLIKRIGNLKGKEVAILGLAFKSNTNDVRESRAIPVIIEIKKLGAHVRAYDPMAECSMAKIIPEIDYYSEAVDSLKGADACVIMTEWDEFRYLDQEFNAMNKRIIIEGRRVLSCKDAEGVCW
jgi:UDPglucose 6-dehydrogenase